MANALKGEVDFTVDGDSYVLKYDINRLCELEDLTGQQAGDLVPKVGKGSMKIMRAFLWAGLKAYDLSLVEAGEVLQRLTYKKAGPLIIEAMRRAFPVDSEDGEADAGEAKAA